MKSKKPIYLVTVIEPRLDGINTCRCWCFFHTLNKAKKCVDNNWGEMQECKYEFLVIEEVYENSTSLNKEWWYKWDRNKWCKLIDKPDRFHNICCFGMG